MIFRVQFIVLAFMGILAVAIGIYSYKRCGWGMFAYQYPFIAALTGECAQQIHQQLREQSGQQPASAP